MTDSVADTRDDDGVLSLAPTLSDFDRVLIQHLQEDGRRSFSQIARSLGVGEKQVRTRVKQLLDDEVVQIAVVTEPAALGYHALALVGLTLDPALAASKVAEQLAALEQVDYVAIVTGRYNIYAEVVCRDMQHLQQIVEQDIGALPGIRSVEIFPYLDLYYQQASYTLASRRPEQGKSGVRARALDNTDKSIIRSLSLNGRASLQSIADELDISESQVRLRLNAMQASGVVQITGIINPMNLGYQAVAWVAIRVQAGQRMKALAESLASIPNVTYVLICAGRYDMFVEVVCPDNEQLLQVLDERIRQLAGVSSLEVSLYLALHYKRLQPTLA